MAKNILIAAAIFILVFSATGYAASTSTSIKAGTLGAGVEVERTLSDSISARVGFNYLGYEGSALESEIDYNVLTRMRSYSAILDWHPFEGTFRLSLGAFYNNHDVEANAKPSSSYQIGDVIYTSTEVSSLTAIVDFDKVSPYIGMGWDTSFDKDGGLGLLCELGVLYRGSPDVTLTATGTAADSETLIQELAKEEDSIKSSLEDYEYYPVLALGLTYRF
jgi:hypothetical protein